MRSLIASTIALCLALAGCGGGTAQPQQASVRDAWISLPAVPGRPGAAYFTMVGGKTHERLTSIDSAAVDKVELHASMSHGGMAGMRPLGEVAVPAGAAVAFAPGGNHAMLFGIDPAIRPGQRISLLFRFNSERSIPVEAEVRAPGDVPPAAR
jgi:hypothetical protein